MKAFCCESSDSQEVRSGPVRSGPPTSLPWRGRHKRVFLTTSLTLTVKLRFVLSNWASHDNAFCFNQTSAEMLLIEVTFVKNESSIQKRVKSRGGRGGELLSPSSRIYQQWQWAIVHFQNRWYKKKRKKRRSQHETNFTPPLDNCRFTCRSSASPRVWLTTASPWIKSPPDSTVLRPHLANIILDAILRIPASCHGAKERRRAGPRWPLFDTLAR